MKHQTRIILTGMIGNLVESFDMAICGLLSVYFAKYLFADNVVKNRYKFDRRNASITDIFPDDWSNKKKITKILLTSCSLGDYLFLYDCHVLDIEVFNAWLFNKEIVWRNTQTMEKVHVSSAKKKGGCLIDLNC